MKVVLVAPLTSQTGNTSSANRIKGLLESDKDVTCDLVSCKGFASVDEFSGYLQNSHADCVLAIHAFRSGHLLTGCFKPYAIVFGGTDVNEYHKDEDKMAVMTAALHNARFVVAFSKPMMLKAKELWPDVCDKIILQPQGIVTNPSIEFCFHKYLHTHYQVPLDSHIFLLVAGIRKVKDPLFLVKCFSDWHHQDETVWFVIVGPHLDVDFSKECQSSINRLPGVLLIDCLSQADTHAAIQDSMAMVNSSLSEGMSAAILEAMDLGTPVIARNIAGNTAIIQHRATGMLYETPQEFIEQAKEVLSNQTLRESLTKNAKQYVTKCHSVEEEKIGYLKLVKNLCHGSIA